MIAVVMALATEREIGPNTAKVTNMIEGGVTCQKNVFKKIKIAIKCNTKITYSVWWCDAMIKDGLREETSKFAALSGCTYNDEICFIGIEPISLLFVIQPEI